MEVASKNCPKCGEEMLCVYSQDTRVIDWSLIVLPGPPSHYHCEGCSYEEDIILNPENKPPTKGTL